MLSATARSITKAGSGMSSIPTRTTTLRAMTMSFERSNFSRIGKTEFFVGSDEVLTAICEFQ